MVKPVVVVGAGVAGLVCARKLHQAGVPVLVVDADDRAGGRLKTDKEDGFLLDRGFQVFLTAYPAARRELDLGALDLKSFAKGVDIAHGGNLHRLEPQSWIEMFQDRFAMVRDNTIPIADKRLLGKFSSSVGELSSRQAFAADPGSAIDSLRGYGFSEVAIDRFFRPMMGGVFADADLEFDVRQMNFVWAMFNQGRTTVPAAGMQAIPDQIAADIPRYLFRLGNRVDRIEVDSHGRAVGVVFDTTERLEASAVVVATDAEQAGRLTGITASEHLRSATCLYFETPTPFTKGPYLVLNGTGSGLVNHVAPVSNVAPSYAPPGKHLAAATVLGIPEMDDTDLAEAVKSELSAWAPANGAYMWRFIRAYRLRNAHMAQPVGFVERRPSNTTKTPGLFWAGEFTENASIDGAIRSGAQCAEFVLDERRSAEAA
jgi:phytoene dehydrogenase-like protein